MQIDTSKLIFCAGAPGSTWSRIIKQLSRCASVDNTDCNELRQYPKTSHFGNYFGPGMEFGEYFFDLSSTNDEQLLLELGRPYTQYYGGGFRLLKSHAFSYNLQIIGELFPNSRKLLIWRDNAECLEWWLEAGGFSINYPNYSWYQNEEVMRKQIAIENKCISDYAQDRGKPLQAMSLKQIAKLLSLIQPEDEIFPEWESPLDHVLISVC